MDQRRILAIQALGDAFGSLRSIGGGPQGRQQALPMALSHFAQEERKKQAQAALQQAQGGEGGNPAFNSPAFQAFASQNPEQALALMAKQSIAGPGERKTIKGADGFQYYQDNGARVLPGVKKPADGWRDATPEELARYGAAAGQVNQSTGKFAPINPATGMRLESDGAGGFTFEQGPGAGGSGLTKRTQGDIESKEFESRDTLARLGNIEENLANPDFMESLTAAGRLKQWGLEWADTLDPKLLSPEQAEYLSGVASARGDVLENVNFTIKAITGAAMTEGEAKRIGATLPQVTDSPTVFKAKLGRTITRTRAAVARYHLWRTQGAQGSPESFETLGNVEKKMNSRAAELRQAVERGAMDATAASAKFRLEFGV